MIQLEGMEMPKFIINWLDKTNYWLKGNLKLI